MSNNEVRAIDKRVTLDDVRVVELCNMGAGPWTAMLLADLGADVVKVEPHSGDLSRSMGGVHVDGESALFIATNRQKRSIRLDLKQEQGVEIFRRLARNADVVVENLRPGTAMRLGVDYDTLRSINPRVIYASISAFGQTGPYSSRAGNDVIVQALGGLMAVTGTPEEPVRVGAPAPDYAAAALMAFGIMVALRERDRSGNGQRIEGTLLDATLAMLGQRFQEYLLNGEEIARFGSGHPSFAPYQCFKTADGEYLYVAVIHDKFWHNLCRAVGRDDLRTDNRFQHNPDRLKFRDELTRVFGEIFATRALADWMSILVEFDVPCAPVNSLSQALSDPQIAHNQPVITLQHSRLGEVQTLGFPLAFSVSQTTIEREPPALGAHTEEILKELGMDDAEIGVLLRNGVC